MDFTHLASFVAVADELHFSRAAARRHLSQPTLSKPPARSRVRVPLGTAGLKHQHGGQESPLTLT